MIVCPQKTNFCSELFMILEKYYMVVFWFFFKKRFYLTSWEALGMLQSSHFKRKKC